MLRLRPSELTLTPEDVEETFRRIAQRRALRNSLVGQAHVSGRHGRPTLKPGPRKSTRDTSMTLSSVPILGSQGYQAVLVTVDKGAEEREQPLNPSTERADHLARKTSPSRGSGSESAVRTGSQRRTMQLPSRPHADQEELVTLRNKEDSSDGSRNTELVQASVPETSGSGHALNHTSGDEAFSFKRPAIATDGTAELRGGGRMDRHRASSTTASTPFVPSSLRRVHKFSSPQQSTSRGDPIKTPRTQTESRPHPHLQRSIEHDQHSPTYNQGWQPLTSRLPYSEPRPPSTRVVLHARSLSSDNASAIFKGPTPTASKDPLEDIFGSASEPAWQPTDITSAGSHSSACKGTYHNSLANLPRTGPHIEVRYLSDSDTSAAFSYYGSLPSGSRQTSSEQSYAPPQAQSPAPCHSDRTGIVQSLHSKTIDLEAQQISSKISPESPSKGLCSLSPLPWDPHARGTARTTSAGILDSAQEEFIDAASAAIRGLPSPLDDYSEQYHRLVQAEYACYRTPIQLQSSQHGRDRSEAPGPRPSHTGRSHEMAQNLHTARAMAIRRQQLRETQSPHQHEPFIAMNLNQSRPRSRNRGSARYDQRSSENAPVNPPFLEVPNDLQSQVQTHRAAFERLHGAVQAMRTVHPRLADSRTARSSVPHATTTQDGFHRYSAEPPRESAMLSRAYRGDLELSSSPTHSTDPTDILLGYDQNQPTGDLQSFITNGDPVQNGSRQSATEALIRARGRSRRPDSAPMMSPVHRRTTRGGPLTALAFDHGSGTTSRRSYSPLLPSTISARVYRQMPARQADQENAPDVEAVLMRQEQRAIDVRHGGDERHHVMDETPPRIGRVERRMLGGH
ncbi:hypothetical protein ACN47E_000819 [Coniothyrium glycines]